MPQRRGEGENEMTKVRKIRTAWDARMEQENRPFTAREVKANRAMAQAVEDARVLAANPQIGKLMRNGRTVFYVNAPEYREASRAADLVA